MFDPCSIRGSMVFVFLCDLCDSVVKFLETRPMQNRRDFLKTSSLVAMGLTVPAFLSRTALAAPPSDKAGAKDTILVVIQLTGGNDGLNTPASVAVRLGRTASG